MVSPCEIDINGGNPLSTHPSSSALNKEDALSELNRRVRTLEQLLSMYAPSRAIAKPRDLGPPSISGFRDVSHPAQDRRVVLNKSRLFGQTHWTNAAHEVSLAPDACQSSAFADGQSSKR